MVYKPGIFYFIEQNIKNLLILCQPQTLCHLFNLKIQKKSLTIEQEVKRWSPIYGF